jgi:hypothetical protein
LRYLVAQFCDLPLCLRQLASIQDYESFGLLPSSPHFLKLALHDIGLSKENVGGEAADDHDSRSKKNHSPSFEAKLSPLLLSVLYVGLLTGLYRLGLRAFSYFAKGMTIWEFVTVLSAGFPVWRVRT